MGYFAWFQSEINYKRVFETLNDIYLETELDGRILLVSPSVNRFGYRPEELIGTDISKFYVDYSDRAQMLKKLLRQKELINYEVIMWDARIEQQSLRRRWKSWRLSITWYPMK